MASVYVCTMFITVGAQSKSYACDGLFAFHCIFFCASEHCTCELPQLLPSLATNLFALTERTPLHYSCHMALVRFHIATACQNVRFACSSGPRGGNMLILLCLQNFGTRTRPTPEPRMLGASLSNLSGTARAIAFPQHVDTTAASHKNESCAPYAPCEAAVGFA